MVLEMPGHVRSIQICAGLVLILLCYSTDGAQQNTASTITKLFQAIEKSQIKHDVPFSWFPFSWQAQKGMYPSDVKLNFHGNWEYHLLRSTFKVPDVNMFTPAWITTCLIEAYEYGKAPRPSADQVVASLNAMSQFKNRNVDYENSEMTFWPQTMNATAGVYQSLPSNLLKLLNIPDHFPDKLLEEVLDLMGLKDIANVIKSLIGEKDMFALAFHIPPDFDDTFVNIGVGSLLADLPYEFARENELWRGHNADLSSIFQKLKKYAYRPFSKLPKENTIDPRTYMYLRSFLEKATDTQQPLALIPTWVQNTEEVKTLLDKGVAMPFNVNNVDITVAANFIYGVVTCVTNQVCPAEFIDQDVQTIFLNTTSLIVHEIANNLSSRPDLALTYYPSKYEFYWFVSRSFAHLHRNPAKVKAIGGEIYQMLTSAYKQLAIALQNKVTTDILRATRDSKDGSYIDNFLGDGDTDRSNKTVNRAEDRIFSTAVSVNTLINIWTDWDSSSLHWQSDTSSIVKDAVSQMVAWLDKHSLSHKYKPHNTFFSGSGKGYESLPFFYPANRMEYFNGTKFSDKNFPSDLHNIIGMSGVVSHDEYWDMLREPHFGMKTPQTFNGYNADAGGFFPFWSSDAYTYATTLVALSHYSNIHLA